MDYIIDLQMEATSSSDIPKLEQFQAWVAGVLSARMDKAELTIRIVDEDEMTGLNEQFRNKKGSTNVLSFPFDMGINIDSEEMTMDYPLLGDIVICAAVVETEARQQNKETLSHWAHMVIHGTLHLLGYDHLTDEQANEMESEEKILMEQFGFSNPYKVNSLK